ncbi:MAG: DUF1624 domain-containing protein [Minwuiales bacterium]|nr:DUF1624 domain-containing protein [Minwuiales bacterium]
MGGNKIVRMLGIGADLWHVTAMTATATDIGVSAERRARLPAVDLARGIAIVGMAIYHFSWDLTYFGLAGFDLLGHPFWLGFRAVVLSTFLLLVGISHVLAQRRGLAARPFLRRLLLIAASAAAITAASYVAFPQTYIFFGVLHCIALSSVLLLAVARLPSAAVAAVAVACLAAPGLVAAPLLDHPWLVWLGLATWTPASNDFVPLLPWFGMVAAGVFLGRALVARQMVQRWHWQGPSSAALQWAGRHSLIIYLLHQPLLFGSLYAVVALAGST